MAPDGGRCVTWKHVDLHINMKWKFKYTVASCWIFYMNYTMMHGSTDIKFKKPSYVVFFCSASRWSLLDHYVFCNTFCCHASSVVFCCGSEKQIVEPRKNRMYLMSHRASCHTCYTIQLMHYLHFKTQLLQHLKPIKCWSDCVLKCE